MLQNNGSFDVRLIQDVTMLQNNGSFDVRLIQDVPMLQNSGSFGVDWLRIWLSTWQSLIKPYATNISVLSFFAFAVTIILGIRTTKRRSTSSNNRQCNEPTLAEKIGLIVAVAPTLFFFIVDIVPTVLEPRKIELIVDTDLTNGRVRAISPVIMILIIITILTSLGMGIFIFVGLLLSRLLAHAIRHKEYADLRNFLMRNSLALAALLCGNVCFHIRPNGWLSWSDDLVYLFFYTLAAYFSAQSFGWFYGLRYAIMEVADGNGTIVAR